MMDIYDWISEQIGEGEPAEDFAGHVRVWSEYAVRIAIIRALKNYKEGEIKNPVDQKAERG